MCPALVVKFYTAFYGNSAEFPATHEFSKLEFKNFVELTNCSKGLNSECCVEDCSFLYNCSGHPVTKNHKFHEILSCMPTSSLCQIGTKRATVIVGIFLNAHGWPG